MTNHKAVIVTSSVVGFASLVLIATTAPQAHAGNFLQDLAQKFGISKPQMQQFRHEHKEQDQAERLQKLTKRLDQAVKDGKLTSAQRDMIITKAKELQQFHESLKDKTPQERHDAMKAKHDEIVQWAKDNNIPVPFALGGHVKHPGMRHMMQPHRR